MNACFPKFNDKDRNGRYDGLRVGNGTQSLRGFDVVGNLRLVSKFDERDPDTFFYLFEPVANLRGWSETDRLIAIGIDRKGPRSLFNAWCS